MDSIIDVGFIIWLRVFGIGSWIMFILLVEEFYVFILVEVLYVD